jgi:hypothetical protein
MARYPQYNLISVLLLIICCYIHPEPIRSASAYLSVIQNNPSDKQFLLNGRIWRNQYSKAVGDQFFLSNEFLKGSVVFNGRRFDNLDLLYDINSDELLLRSRSYPVIIMNKEMVDSFSLVFNNRNYHVINAGNDSPGILRGYVNIIYEGPSTLYVKYKKAIQPLAVDGRYDLFHSDHSVYLKKGEEIVTVTRKKELINLLEDKRKEIRLYLKSNGLKLRQKDPETYIPVLRYYDSLKE